MFFFKLIVLRYKPCIRNSEMLNIEIEAITPPSPTRVRALTPSVWLCCLQGAAGRLQRAGTHTRPRGHGLAGGQRVGRGGGGPGAAGARARPHARPRPRALHRTLAALRGRPAEEEEPRPGHYPVAGAAQEDRVPVHQPDRQRGSAQGESSVQRRAGGAGVDPGEGGGGGGAPPGFVAATLPVNECVTCFTGPSRTA